MSLSGFPRHGAAWVALVVVSLLFGHACLAEPVSNGPPYGVVDVNLRVPTEPSGSGALEAFKIFCELAAALAWPAVAGTILYFGRSTIPRLMTALIALLEKSEHVRILDIIDIETKKAGREAAARDQVPTEVPAEERETAGRLARYATEIKLEDVEKLLADLGAQYEETRRGMDPGRERTRAMNVIAAKMHTLSGLARPLLPVLVKSRRDGDRLAAICILEINPDLGYVWWLASRIETEVPFLMFHAALALRESARVYGEIAREGMRRLVSQALEALDKFERTTGKSADVNTRKVLQSILSDLDGKSA